MTTTVQSGNHSSNDPFPWGGYSDAIGQVPVLEAGYLTMGLRMSCSEWDIDGKKVQVDAGLDGTIWVTIPDQQHPVGREGSRHFVVQVRPVLEAIMAHLDAEASGG